jgi:hypothetical protein
MNEERTGQCMLQKKKRWRVPFFGYNEVWKPIQL